MKKQRTAISYRLRFEVLKRDGFACRYCGARAPNVVLHLDHVVPVARGGDDSMPNLCACCSACNLGKGDEPIASDTICAYLREERRKHELPRAQREAEEAADDALEAEHAAVAGGVVAELRALRPVFKTLERRLGRQAAGPDFVVNLLAYVRNGVAIERLLAEARDCGDYVDFAIAAHSLAEFAAEDAERQAARAPRAVAREAN